MVVLFVFDRDMSSDVDVKTTTESLLKLSFTNDVLEIKSNYS